MKKYALLIILMCLFVCVFAPASAEKYEDAYKLLSPLFTQKISPWEMDKDTVWRFANSLPGFTCTGVMEANTTVRLICRSEYGAYQGQYKLIFEFWFTDELQAAELQISHPTLESQLENGIYNHENYLTDMYRAFIGNSFVEVTDMYPPVMQDFNHVFSDKRTIPYMNFKFNGDSMYSNGFLPTEHISVPNRLVIVVSNINYFNRKQYVEEYDPETGKTVEYVIASWE